MFLIVKEGDKCILLKENQSKLKVKYEKGGLHGFQFGRMELPNFQNLATTTK